MKKGVMWIAVSLIMIALLFVSITLHNHQTEALLCTLQATYPVLSSLPDFDWLSDQPDGSFLLHKYGEPDQSAALPEDIADMLRARTLLGLRKTGDDVFFITGGAADDEWGYVITTDEAVCMEGLWHLDRIDSHAYRFTTMR